MYAFINKLDLQKLNFKNTVHKNEDLYPMHFFNGHVSQIFTVAIFKHNKTTKAKYLT